jgi:pyruvate/2-oxoglutarate dehydrogenase complex dihydrolipoamide dehydrogenase (E3) component
VIKNDKDGQEYETVVDCVLLATGRKPNVEGLNIEAAGVKANTQGIEVDDRLCTANPNVYAVGDCMEDGL